MINKPQILLRIFLWMTLSCFLGFFVYKGVVPSGEIVYNHDFERNSRFFTDLRPSDRIEDEGKSQVKVTGDPVYFSLYSPRRFDRAELQVKYKTNNTPSVIEAGVLIDKENWQYELKPICNKIINQLSLVWDLVNMDGVILLQKEKNFDSIEGFMNDLPENEKIAVYNFDLESDYLINDYKKLESGTSHNLSVPFVGAWQSLVYLKDEDFDTSLDFFSINGQYDNEGIDVMLFYEKILIASNHLDLKSEDKVMNLSALNLPEGVYKLELRASDNVVTEKINMKQNKIVFPSTINLFSGDKKDFDVFSDSKNVQITTVNSDDLQKVVMNDEEFVIDETYRQFEIKTFKASSTVQFAKLTFEKSGFKMSGDGVFAFSEESFFNPRIKKLDRNVDVMGDGIEYVIAKYDSPLEADDWRVSKAEFDIGSAYREAGEYEFMISIPGLRADDSVDDFLVIDEIKVTFKGKSLKKRIAEFFLN